MTITEAKELTGMVLVGQSWYLWGQHYEVRQLRNGRALILPRGRRRPRAVDWVEAWRIVKYGVLT